MSGSHRKQRQKWQFGSEGAISKHWHGFQEIVVESYAASDGSIHIRPVRYQVFEEQLVPTELRVECPYGHRTQKVGTQFKMWLGWKQNRGGRWQLYSEIKKDHLYPEFKLPGEKMRLEQLTRDDLIAAIFAYNDTYPHQFKPSTTYDVVYGSGRYPPKAIVGLAATLRTGVAYGPKDFRGGQETACFNVLEQNHFIIIPKTDQANDEVEEEEIHFEGASRRVRVNRFERDRNARNKCVAHYGAKCSACDFDFQKCFGELGDGYIHVHHIVPLSEIRASYAVDPIKDLRPICPNCHVMLHRSRRTLSIEELKKVLDRQSAKQSMK